MRTYLSIAVLSTLLGCATARPAPSNAASVAGGELVQRGVELARQGDDLGAEQYFDAAIKAGYPAPAATRLMVSSCLAGGRLERARSHAQRYVDRHPEDWIFHHMLASIEFAEGNGGQARAVLELLLDEHPEHAPSHFLLGLVLRDQLGELDGARAAFEGYLALAPEGEHADEARAWVRRSKNFPTARKGKSTR
jgi:tetratricopeptide (TPR) repeat protein